MNFEHRTRDSGSGEVIIQLFVGKLFAAGIVINQCLPPSVPVENVYSACFLSSKRVCTRSRLISSGSNERF